MYNPVCTSMAPGKELKRIENDVRVLCASTAVFKHVLGSAFSGDRSEPEGAVADAFRKLAKQAGCGKGDESCADAKEHAEL